MILAGQTRAGKPGLPWLVFLHGFSGDCHEWQAVGASLPENPQLYLDLPGHGNSGPISASGFRAVSQSLHNTLRSYNILNYWLVGYSLGGRIAMYHACQQPDGLCGLIVEGGHPGLQDAQQRQQRRQADGLWAARFANEPLDRLVSATGISLSKRGAARGTYCAAASK